MGDRRSLRDRVVVVTGACRGIGREVALRAALPLACDVREGVDDFSVYRLAECEENLSPNFYLSAALTP